MRKKYTKSNYETCYEAYDGILLEEIWSNMRSNENGNSRKNIYLNGVLLDGGKSAPYTEKPFGDH